VRRGGRIVSVAVTIAIGVNNDGRREVLGIAVGCSEAETFWTEFLRTLARRGLSDVKLVISDAHEGLKAAIARVLNATWQRLHTQPARTCRAQRPPDRRRLHRHHLRARGQDRIQWCKVINQIKPSLPKFAAFMDETEDDVLAYMHSPPRPG
jgi:transposase-like protein